MKLSDRTKKSLTAYVNLMSEARARLSWIDHIIDGKTGLDGVVANESAYLQIRLVCEIVALSCLVAHGDIESTQTPKLQKQWSASVIFAELEKLHPSFFPTPRRLVSLGPGKWHFDYVTHDPLTKQKFLELYGQAGDVLHRGHLKSISSGRKTLSSDLATVKLAFESLRNLLMIHEMALSNGNRFACQLNNADGEVQAFVGVAVS